MLSVPYFKIIWKVLLTVLILQDATVTLFENYTEITFLLDDI